MGSGIPPGSRQDSQHSPGSRRDLAEVARFPGGILPGKNPAAYLGKNLAEKSVLAEIPPRKILSSGIPARILPGTKSR